MRFVVSGRAVVVWAHARAVAVAFDHVVLGAAGATGSSVVCELAARGLRVRAVTPAGTADVPQRVEQVAADVSTTNGARRACEGAAVVYHCAQPDYKQWLKLFPPLTQAVLDGAADADAKLVFADNLYMYGPPDGPMTEETPQRAQGNKGRTRIEMADALLRAHADGKLRCTIGRSSDYYGPRGTTSNNRALRQRAERSPGLCSGRASWAGVASAARGGGVLRRGCEESGWGVSVGASSCRTGGDRDRAAEHHRGGVRGGARRVGRAGGRGAGRGGGAAVPRR